MYEGLKLVAFHSTCSKTAAALGKTWVNKSYLLRNTHKTPAGIHTIHTNTHTHTHTHIHTQAPILKIGLVWLGVSEKQVVVQ